jgi:hypothetical protein
MLSETYSLGTPRLEATSAGEHPSEMLRVSHDMDTADRLLAGRQTNP